MKILTKDIAKLCQISARSVEVEMSRDGLSLLDFSHIFDFIFKKRIKRLKSRTDVSGFLDKFRKKEIESFKKGKKCAKCGEKNNLVIHHLDFDHFNESPKNKIVLCNMCHLELHQIFRKAIKNYYTSNRDNSSLFINLQIKTKTQQNQDKKS